MPILAASTSFLHGWNDSLWPGNICNYLKCHIIFIWTLFEIYTSTKAPLTRLLGLLNWQRPLAATIHKHGTQTYFNRVSNNLLTFLGALQAKTSSVHLYSGHWRWGNRGSCLRLHVLHNLTTVVGLGNPSNIRNLHGLWSISLTVSNYLSTRIIVWWWWWC